MTVRRAAALLPAFALSSVFGSAGVFAQSSVQPSGSAESAASDVQDIIVTANKRDERLRDVASSVTAITGEDLVRTQTLDLQDLAGKVPGLELEQSGFGAGTRIILRGLNSGGAGSIVATVVDDIPFSISGSNAQGASLATDFEPYDLRRVEVLRGPQGTLYGATAEGGLIKYVTNPPDLDDFHAGIETGGQSIEHGGLGASGKGFVNIPIIPGELAVRASGYAEQLPGFINNHLDGGTETNQGARYGGRVSVLWQPDDALSIRATAFYQELLQGANSKVEVNGSLSPDRYALPFGYNYNTFLPEQNSTRAAIYSLDAGYDFGFARLQSISSYGTLIQNFIQDNPSYTSLLGPGITLTNIGSYPLKKFSQEVRLSSEPGATLFGNLFDWQTGLFYTHETVATLFNYYTRSYPGGAYVLTPDFSPTTSNVLRAQALTHYQEAAVYLDGTYHFTDTIDLEGGVRVFNNRQDFLTTQGGVFLASPFVTLPRTKSTETNTTFSVAPRWHVTPDTLLYVRIASGYRPGGPVPPIPNGPPGLPSTFASDSTLNYEVGIKASLLDRRVALEATAYRIEWDGIQVPVGIPIGGVAYNITQNAGSAVSQGFEWDVTWFPISGLSLGVLGSFDDAHLSADAAGLNAKNGDRLPYVPAWSGNIHADYEREAFADYTAFVGARWSYTGPRSGDFSLFSSISHVPVPSYNSLEAQAGVRDGRYTFEIYGRNLTDQRGLTFYTPSFADVNLAYGSAGIIVPRTIGFRLAAQF